MDNQALLVSSFTAFALVLVAGVGLTDTLNLPLDEALVYADIVEKAKLNDRSAGF